MPDYKTIQNHCLKIQRLTSTVIDDFLIYYAAQQDKLNREVEKQLSRYSHISKKLPEAWRNMSITQYIGHRVFRREGLIKKYINQSGLSHLTDEEMAFLEFQKEHPWRFSFAEITGRPEKDFFKMFDVFTDESYLIYSPGMTEIQQTQNPVLWFNLLAFNGECFQTYGPVSAYSAFEPEDIKFFATELNRGLWFESGRELMENVEQNPVPYMLLFFGSRLPITFHKDDQIVQILAEYLDDSFDADVFGKEFTKEYSEGVYKLSPAGWDQFPHYSAVYYDEEEKLLSIYSMTDRGFRNMVDRMNSYGYSLSYEPDIRVNMVMVETAKEIFRKEIRVNEYEKLFSIDEPKGDTESLKNINAMLAELIPYINDEKKPDLIALASRYGVEPEEAREIYEQILNKVESRK